MNCDSSLSLRYSFVLDSASATEVETLPSEVVGCQLSSKSATPHRANADDAQDDRDDHNNGYN